MQNCTLWFKYFIFGNELNSLCVFWLAHHICLSCLVNSEQNSNYQQDCVKVNFFQFKAVLGDTLQRWRWNTADVWKVIFLLQFTVGSCMRCLQWFAFNSLFGLVIGRYFVSKSLV